MERIQSINSQRLTWCCDSHGITPQELASQLGIAPRRLEAVMAGGDGLTFNQLRQIADFFGRGVLFFLEEGAVDDTQIHTPQFRTLANQKPTLSPKLKALIQRAEKQREIYLSLREELDDADWVHFTPPNLAKTNLPEAAHLVRQWLGLAAENNFETYRTAVEAQGILVFQSNGYSGKWQIAKNDPILGFTLYDPSCPVIVIKKQRSKTRQTFTLMHELGHLLLHKASAIDDEQDIYDPHTTREQEANAFAGQLLVPHSFLATIADSERPDKVAQYDEWLAQPRQVWGVSSEVILRRLLDVGRLSQDKYQAYRQWWQQSHTAPEGRGNRQYRYREPKHIFGNTFVRTVFDALNAQHITLAKASSYLDNLKIHDLHKLERHSVGL
ncbi:MAG: peptidase [Anaerolineaceae bacterium]|nr:peptidase [Anaerolineaceae bacterium]